MLDEHLTVQLTCSGAAPAVANEYEQDLGVSVTGTGMTDSNHLQYAGFSDSAGTLPSAVTFDPTVGTGSAYNGTSTLQFTGSVPTGNVTYSLIWAIVENSGSSILATDTAEVTCPGS